LPFVYVSWYGKKKVMNVNAERGRGMNEGKKRALQWFLDFLHVDITALDVVEKTDLSIQARALLQGFVPPDAEMHVRVWIEEDFPDEEDSVYIVFGRKLERLQDLQRGFRGFFRELTARVQRAYEFESLWLPVPLFRETSIAAPLAGNFTVQARIVAEENSWVSEYGGSEPNELHYWQEGSLDNAVIRTSTVADSHEDTFKYQFLRALDGLPLGALRQCQECKRWFLHFTKRKRSYCSNKCAARKGRRERWKQIKETGGEIYESVLAKSRERAHDSYERKVRKNHPKAKVERRSRKKGKENQ
jgi:hypothetical protein